MKKENGKNERRTESRTTEGATWAGKEKKIIDFHLKKAISKQVLWGKKTVWEALSACLSVCEDIWVLWKS